MLVSTLARSMLNAYMPTPLACLLQVRIGMFAPSTGKIDDRWQRFMQFQIKRSRDYFSQAEAGVDFLDKNARWPVW